MTKYLTIVLLAFIISCTKSTAPAMGTPTTPIHMYYGAAHHDAAQNWAVTSGEDITVMADPEVVLFFLQQETHVVDSVDFRATKVLPLMKDCNMKTGIDHMELWVMPRDVAIATIYYFKAADFQ